MTQTYPQDGSEPTRTIETGYGRLTVPESLLRIWDRYDWPREDVLRGMAQAGSVEADTAQRTERT